MSKSPQSKSLMYRGLLILILCFSSLIMFHLIDGPTNSFESVNKWIYTLSGIGISGGFILTVIGFIRN